MGVIGPRGVSSRRTILGQKQQLLYYCNRRKTDKIDSVVDIFVGLAAGRWMNVMASISLVKKEAKTLLRLK